MDEEPEVMDLSTWEGKLQELAAEPTDAQIRLPARTNGKRVNREEIAHALVTSFELVGGVPRLAYWADANYGEFMKIFGRLLPKESIQTHNGEVKLVHAVPPSKLDEQT
jgi:hypothetical protein